MAQYLAPSTLYGVPFLAPWVAPEAAAPVLSVSPGQIVYLAPGLAGGLPFLAPLLAPLASSVTGNQPKAIEVAFFAPPMIDGRFFLAPPRITIQLDVPQDVNGGGRAARSSSRSTVTRAKSSPAPAPTPYHSNAYEQLELAAAAELADEEIVLTFLLELALHD